MELRTGKTFTYIICGKARHGKDTIADIIKEYYQNKGMPILNIQYSSYIKEYAKKISNWDGRDETKPRELLQQLGTNIIRHNIDELFFINRICEDIKVYTYFFDALTISDARFKLEVDVPKTRNENIIAIHVDRPDFDNGLTEEQKNHPTEIDLDDYDKYDYKFVNNSTIEDLKTKVIEVLEVIENER